MSRYDEMLIRRAHVWGRLCADDRKGQPTDLDALREGAPDPADLDALLARLQATGLIQVDSTSIMMTPRGHDAALATLRTGTLPTIVQHDPGDWRQRAWTAMRIHRRFTSTDIARVCDAPSTLAVQRWCKALAEAGHLRDDGFDSRGPSRRLKAYRMVSCTPDAPQLATRKVAEEARTWPRRVWAALYDQTSGGQGTTSKAVSEAAGVSRFRVGRLLVELMEAGVVERPERTGLDGGGSAWLYVLVPGSRDRARHIVDRAEVPFRQPWQSRAWRLLRGGEQPTPGELGEMVGVTRKAAWRWLEALRDGGHVEREETDEARTANRSHRYRLADGDQPETCPAVRTNARRAAEVSHA